ncbi:MAG: AraC family transcriptional regulator [Lachnospiraceae bacterium]|nr:AraC family transcriptional regulator [Lachnospiraceae bacterium]
MKKFYNKLQPRLGGYATYLRYFFSYLIIVTVLIVSFFLVIKNQLSRRYFEQRSLQAKVILDDISEQIDENLIYLSQVDASLKSNIKFIRETYKTEGGYKYYTHQELTQYVSTTKIIESIVYLTEQTNDLLTTRQHVVYKDGLFHLIGDATQLIFDPSLYYNATSGQLIFLSDGSSEYLIYFPAISAQANYTFFYILDRADIQEQMKNRMSDEMTAIALVDSDGRFITGINSSQLLPYMDSLDPTGGDGIFQIDRSTSLCVHTGVGNKFSMITLLSNQFLNHQINQTFANTYAALMLIGVVGFFLILLAMRITYLPLSHLTKKLVADSDTRMDYLELLDQTFSRTEQENQQLKCKLDNYRLSMQKSLLDTVLSPQQGDKASEKMVFNIIDQLFDAESNSDIYAVQITSPGKLFPGADIQRYFQEVLPGENSCLILESHPDSAVFLINYIGTELNKDEVLKALLNQLYEDHGYRSAISNGTDSPLDIPAIYENMLYASRHWAELPVVDYQTLPPAATDFAYPHNRLNQFSALLKKHQFSAAGKVADELFQIIKHALSDRSRLPDFFVRCILLDMLSVITNCMNQFGIDFNAYDDLYYETVYFCRSCPCEEKAADIVVNVHKLLALYEREIATSVNPALIRSVIEESYSNPDFSITLMADRFHVSIAYMSYLVKQELGQNFSDYLWALRLEKAKELLLTTDTSIDEISVTVGYLNVASFRRKFKQETGLTPSQFRVRPSHTVN